MLAKVILLTAIANKVLGHGTSSGRTASAETSLNLFIPPGLPGSGFVGSVVNADSCGTTVAIACTSGYGNAKTTVICFPSSTVIATYAGSSFGISTQYTIAGAVGENIQTCSLDGTTAAVCSETYSASVGGHKTSTSATHTLREENIHFNQVTITAGAGKLSHLAACTLTSNAAAPTGLGQVYKVVVVQGAAALLAGALI